MEKYRIEKSLEQLNIALNRIKTININNKYDDIIIELEKALKNTKYKNIKIAEKDYKFCLNCAWKSLLRYLAYETNIIEKEKIEEYINRIYENSLDSI